MNEWTKVNFDDITTMPPPEAEVQMHRIGPGKEGGGRCCITMQGVAVHHLSLASLGAGALFGGPTRRETQVSLRETGSEQCGYPDGEHAAECRFPELEQDAMMGLRIDTIHWRLA